jgi:hypothetical protein
MDSIGGVQILWKEAVAEDRYVADRAWERAILCECPLHPAGGCGLRRLGTYGRVVPAGTRVARWWCPRGRRSVSLLPAFLAARLSGSLQTVEAAVAAVEQSGSIAAAVDLVHPPDAQDAVGWVSAVRGLQRRARAVRATLLAIITLMPELFVGVVPTLAGFRAALGCNEVLVTLRHVAQRHLAALPTPVGFGTRASG